MKNKIIFIVILLLTPFFILNFFYPNDYTQSPPFPPAPQQDKFIYGAIQSIWSYPNYDSLKLNTTHCYIGTVWDTNLGRHVPMGWAGNPSTGNHDSLMTPVSEYADDLRSAKNIMYQHNQSRFFYQRPKIEWLAFGQSSTYEAEQISPTDDLWFYSFNVSNGTSEPDNIWNEGKHVLHCGMPAYGPNAGIVLKQLKANTEQCKSTQSDGTDNHWQYDTESTWYIKPRIRIDSTIVDNNPNINVCRIIVINQELDTLKNTIIKARNFLDNNNNYNGRYIEEFRIFSGDDTLTYNGAWGDWWGLSARGDRTTENGSYNRTDIQVYWYDNCDMWLDYVKVENDVAHNLLTSDTTNQTYQLYNQWIKDEALLADEDPAVEKFYVEIIEFNNLPCINYVNQKLRQHTGNRIDLIVDFDPAWGLFHHVNAADLPRITDADWLGENFIERGGFSAILSQCYPMRSRYHDPIPNDPDFIFSRIPPTLPSTNGPGILAIPTADVDQYDEWLQTNFDHYPFFLENGTPPDHINNPNHPCGSIAFNEGPKFYGYMRYTLKVSEEVSRDKNIPFIFMPQAHQWYYPWEIEREPTNEELDVMANLAVSYGARGLMWWWYPGYTTNTGGSWGCRWETFGMSYDGDLREENVYQQAKFKWHQFRDIGSRMKTWEPYIMSFDNTNRRSYIYRLEDERNDCINETYFRYVVSYKSGSGLPPCVNDYPDTNDAPAPEGLIYECNEDRYLQASVFKKTPDDGNRYFMIVNRRCSPKQLNSTNDGDRFVRVIFDQNSSEFPTYNSWKIVDIENMDSEIGSFDKTALVPYVDLGWFEPGQGKLYIIVPVLPNGGELAADEIITGGTFTCEAPVYNNGFDITIEAGTTIHFNDSSRFIMNGGVFTVGNQNVSGSQNITCDAVNGTSWLGHSFTNCEVKIYGASFSGMTNDTAYAVSIVDCPVVDIRNCTFNSAQSLKGAINAVFYNNPFAAISNVYLYGNTFNSSGSTIPTVNISSYAGLTLPLIIEGNTFNNGNTAIFLTGVTGGAIKGNTITDNYYGLNVLTSSVDIFENTISSTVNGSIGVFSGGGSEIRLNKAGSLLIGGQNTITNTGSASNNIKVEGATFLLADGENVFDIASNQSAYHLYGWFPYFTAVSYDETDNCFKVDNSPVDPPVNLVTDGYQGSALSFTFQPYLTGCEIIGGGDGFVINLGDGIYDTLYNEGQGAGGSRSSVASVRRTDIKQNSQTQAFDLPSAKQKYDSISVLLRYRNYPLARTKCIDLINTYPDSIQSLNAISKLFLASTASDTTINGASELKIYYENLILNHPNNVSLVKRANYFILKCKVRMRQYTQALAGFQQIINQNPYSYEGLIARWDYMATSLLVQGQSGGERGISDLGLGISDLKEEDVNLYIDDNLQSENRNPESTGEKNPFTKEQRQDIRKSINTAIEISKNDDETKMKSLEQRSQLGDVNASRELSQMNSLKQVVKTEKPQNILQHVRIISEDIRKVFGEGTSLSKINPNNVPTVYRLSQNYPNPFNPVTKINYDLPRDAKVTIIIYDILGREVKRLVNNEIKKAGAYIVDFNALNYASGVYFYRIEAEETGGFKFVDSKKMVLLK